jgi:YVTN family beta-propeller protein
MHRVLAAAVFIAVFFSGYGPALRPAEAGELLVVSKKEQKLAFYNTDTGELLGSAATGRDPREVVVSPDGRRAYVSDFGDLKNTVSVFDVPGRSLVKRIEIKKIYGPHGLVITNDGKSLFVTLEKSRSVARIDLASGRVAGKYDMGMSGSHYLALSPDNHWLYVANTVDDNVTLIDLTTNEIDRHLIAGDYPEGLAVSPDGAELWVGCQGTNNVAIVDTQTKKRVDQLQCPGSPTRLEFTPDGSRVLVTCTTFNDLVVFDASTREVIERVSAGATPFDIEIEPEGQTAYVGFAADNQVGVFSLESLEFVRTFDTVELPAGLAYIE